MRRLYVALLLVVGLAVPAWAATPGLVTRKLGDTNAGNGEVACGPNNKCTLVTPQPTKANNLLILWLVHHFSADRTVTITDNQSNTWTLAATASNSGAGLDLRAYYVCGVAAGTSVVTVNFDAPIGSVRYAFEEYFNVATTNCLDNSSVNAAATAPTVSSASLTPTSATAGTPDLITHFSQDTTFLGLGGTTPTGLTAGSGFSLLTADAQYPAVSQFRTVTSNAAFTPSVSVTGSTDTFVTIALAFKSASAGSPRGTGLEIAGIIESFAADGLGTANRYFTPTYGDALVAITALTSTQWQLSSVTSMPARIWTTACASGCTVPIDADVPQYFLTCNSTPDATMTITLTHVSAQSHLWKFYDLSGADAASSSSCRDKDATAANTEQSGDPDVAHMPDITPTNANGLVIASLNMGLGPPSMVTSPTGTVSDLMSYPYVLTTTGTTANGVATVTAMGSLTNITVNMSIRDTTGCIPTNTYIVSIDSSTQVTISNAGDSTLGECGSGHTIIIGGKTDAGPDQGDGYAHFVHANTAAQNWTWRIRNQQQTTSVSATAVAIKAMLQSDQRTPSLTVAYAGKLRDRVGPSSVALGADGALDGTLTVTLSGAGGRTITRLQLQSSAPGTWDTDGATSAWVLGVASTLDGALVNSARTMAVNFTVADGGTFYLFAADWANIEFVAGTTLTITAVFDDGSTASASTVAAAIAAPSLAVTYSGKLRDRVGQSSVALGADGGLDGTLTVTLSASGGRTITRLQLQSSAPGSWDTDAATSAWVLGVASTLDGALVNDASTMAVNFTVADGGTFYLFAADWANVEFVASTTLTVTAVFDDGSTASASTVAAAIAAPSLAVTYSGKLRDRVGQSSVALGADGGLDGTLTVTLHATGGRTITHVQLQSSAPGSWDTEADTPAWLLGVASSLDGALVNDASTMAVNFTVADGGTFYLFAADWANVEFVAGTTLTVTAVFDDGSTASASTVAVAIAAPSLAVPSLAVTYNGKLRDRVGQSSVALGADGGLDGTLTVTLSASGGRAITRLQLQSSAPGSWDTDAATSAWVLGVATTLDGTLLNDPGTMAVSFPVPDGGSFCLFAADFANIEFVPGVTLTVTAVFSDGSSAQGSVTVPPS